MIEPGQVLKTIEELREAINLQSDEITFECFNDGRWEADRQGARWNLPFAITDVGDVRRTPVSKLKTVSLGPEDIPPGSVIRLREGGLFFTGSDVGWESVIGVGRRTVSFCCWDAANGVPMLINVKYAELQHCLIKRPGEDWQPCHKLSE